MRKLVIEEGIVNNRHYRVISKREYYYLSDSVRITYTVYKVQMKVPFVPIWITIKKFKDSMYTIDDAKELYNAIIYPNKFM